MRLLHIVATPRSHESNTVRISNAIIEAFYIRYSDLKVHVLDLFKADLPAVAGDNIDSKYKLMTGQALDDHHQSSWAAIEHNIQLFLDTDLYVLTTPMWNFGIPYALKYYIDAIVQPGYLFRYREDGTPEGLVLGKKMIVVTSRGGDYSANSALQKFDFVEPYLRAVFNFVGICDLHFINAQPMDVSLDIRRSAILAAIDEGRALVNNYPWETSLPVEGMAIPEGVKPAPVLGSCFA